MWTQVNTGDHGEPRGKSRRRHEGGRGRGVAEGAEWPGAGWERERSGAVLIAEGLYAELE